MKPKPNQDKKGTSNKMQQKRLKHLLNEPGNRNGNFWV